MHQATYGLERLDDLREQLTHAATFDMYAERFDDAGVDVSTLSSWEEFERLPFTTGADIVADITENPPEGTLYPGVSMLSFTPSGDDIFPVYETRHDIDFVSSVNAKMFADGGLREGDRVLLTFGYHLLGTGYILHRALEELGAEVIPAGPGNTSQAAETIDEFDVDALMGNPSFALKLAKEMEGSVRVFAGGGEPFTSVPGKREEVKEALSCEVAFDFFGTRWSETMACECEAEDGMHVATELAIVEIIDPDTTEVLPPGKRGEIVITHVEKEGMPMVRYRTGDLGELAVEECGTCGRSVTMPGGVLGRTDNRVKAKGIKLYPESVGSVLSGFERLSGEFHVELSAPDDTDHVRIVCEGTAPREELAARLSDRLLIAPDEIAFVDDLEEGPVVVDERY
jgi:phenylacetate-CoA ligase